MSVQQLYLAVLAALIAIPVSAYIALCCSKRLQRHVFYLHKLPIWWGQKLDIPETFGFLRNQILPLRIPTSDGESLYAWLIAPLALYVQNEKEFLWESTADVNPENTALRLLQNGESRLVIYFHGNAGSIDQPRRTDAYRMLSTLSSNLFVLAFDYRGFALSSGSPSKAGLIEDALAVIKWATSIGQIPTHRIVLLAQSLGTAVAVAAFDRYLQTAPDTRFAGVVLCAAFRDASTAILEYRIFGRVPILAPFNAVQSLQSWFRDRFYDT